MKNNKKIVIFTVIFTLLLTLSLVIVFVNKDSELVTKLLFNKTETNVKNSNTSTDGKASLNTYQHSSNYVKAEWAVKMVDANVLYRTGFEPVDDLPVLTYNSTGNRKFGGQEFTTEDKYSGNHSLKVVDSYTNGNYTNSNMNGIVSYQEYSVADFRERKFMENGTDLSVSFYARTTGTGRLTLSGVGGRADYGTPINNYFLDDTKIDDKVIRVSNPQFFKDIVDKGNYYYIANMKGAYTNYVYVTGVDLATSKITLSGGLKGEFKAGDNILAHAHRNPVTFSSRSFTSDSGWTLFNINTKVLDNADYNTLLRGFQLWINTYTRDTVYIDDLQMGYATKVQLFREDVKLYEGLLSDYEDKAAKDKAKPNKVETINVKGEGGNLKLNITKPDDNGTKYNYTLKTLSKTDVVESVVSTEALVNSGIKGYSYVIDKNSSTVPDNTIDTTTESATININSNDVYYIHLKSIDNAGNVSDVSHFTFQDNGNPELNVISNNNGLTDGAVTLTATATDKETLIKRIQLPNGVWVNSNVATYEVTTNGKYKFIAEDIAGNITTKSITIKNIKLKLDVTPIHKDDYINLKWSRIDGDQNYNYMLYKKEKEEAEFQSIQSNDNLKVLNVYPTTSVNENITFTTWKGETKTLPKSASLEMWMESPNAENAKGYGMGLIDVDNVTLGEFNSNSPRYLKDSDGKMLYDVIFFGTWDCNGDCGVGGDLSPQSRDSVREYISKGKGVLLGHDTIIASHPNMASLQSDMNIVVHNGEIAMENMGAVEVELVRKGNLTNYPWKIGDIGTVLNIPHTHISNQEVRGDVWLRFYNYSHFSGTYTNDIDTKYTNAYLTTWNNTGMIQTGHSMGAATSDEQKILANSLFSLNQITEGNEWNDRSGQDIHAPNKPELISVDVNSEKTKLKLDFNDVKDNGTTYNYYVEATGIVDGEKVPSNIETATIKSELKGYSVVIDNNKDTIPDNIIETEESILNIDLEKDKDVYIHIVAVDNVGNVSDVYTYFADITAPQIEFTPSETSLTKGPINLTIDVKDTGSGIKEIILPDGTVTTNEKTMLEINKNGIYKVIATDKVGNVREKEYEVKNINREPELEVNLVDFTGKVKNNELALYSEKVGKDKIILDGKAMDEDNGILKVNYKIINESGNTIKSDTLLENNLPGVWQQLNKLEIPVTTMAEGKYKIEVVATDSINIQKKVVLEFIVDKTSPTAKLEKNNNKIAIKDAKDNLVGLLDKPYSLEYKVNNESTFKDYQKNKQNSEFNLATETSSSKYTYRGYVEDKVSNVKVTNLVEYITSVDVVEAIVSEDRPNTIKIGFERQIKVEDGLKIEIKRNGNVVNYITDGNVFTDENLDYEKQYEYEITVLGNKDDGSVLKSETVVVQLKTGVPKLIVDFIEAKYDKSNDYYIVNKTIFNNLVQFNADIEYKPGGLLVVEYEDLGGKSIVERNLTSVIKNKFLFNFRANSNDIISMNMYLKNSREFTEITKTVKIKEVLPVIKDVSEHDKSKYYR